jgi:sulfate/thiosulfate transport system permease protein
MRGIVFVYLAFLLVIPLSLILYRTFEHGLAPVWHSLTTHQALHAIQVTLYVSLWAVALNTLFGITAAILIVRHEFRGKRIFNALIDLPLAVSPVVVGLSLILVYGRLTPVGRFFGDHGHPIIFALPGMVLATAFVSLPLMVREVMPVLEEIGVEQEQAAWTLGASARQTFKRITYPSIRWAVAYGVVLTLARSLGEFGAVAVVSGRIVNQTQTITLFVQERYENFDAQSAYAASFFLAAIAVLVLLLMNLLRPKEPN